MIKLQHPFPNVRFLFRHYGIIKKEADYWRLTEALVGQIHGLDNTHGVMLATNGILCLIQREHDTNLFEGHIDNFVPYNPKVVAVQTETGVEVRLKKAKTKGMQISEELMAELLNL